MLPNSTKRIGETLEITLKVDNKDRTIKPHPKLVKALRANKEAKRVTNSASSLFSLMWNIFRECADHELITTGSRPTKQSSVLALLHR